MWRGRRCLLGDGMARIGSSVFVVWIGRGYGVFVLL
jgi:hypothetical protein